MISSLEESKRNALKACYPYDASDVMHQYYDPPETDIRQLTARAVRGNRKAILDLSLFSVQEQNAALNKDPYFIRGCEMH